MAEYTDTKSKSLPELDDIVELATSLVKDASDRLKLQDDCERAYLTQLGLGVEKPPKWILETHSTQPTDTINWIVDMIASSKPQFEFIIPDDAVEANALLKTQDIVKRFVFRVFPQIKRALQPQSTTEQLAESMENQLDAILEQNDEHQAQTLDRQLMYYGALFDMLVVKCADMRMLGLWRDEDPTQEGRSPFIVRAKDPRGIFCMYDDNGLAMVLERSTMKLAQVKAMYPKVDLGEDAKELCDINNNVAYCEVWTPDYMCAWIESVYGVAADVPALEEVRQEIGLQKPKPNPYGFIPYLVKVCRGTYKDINPILKSGVESGLFARLDLFLTMSSTESYKAAIGQYKRRNVPKDTPPMVLDFSKPNVYDLTPPIADIDPLVSPLAPQIPQMVSMLSQMAERTTVSKLEINKFGDAAASAINLLVHETQLVLAPIIGAGKEIYAGIPKMVYAYVRKYAEIDAEAQGVILRTGTGEKKIDPAQLPKWFSVRVNWRANTPQDQMALIRSGIEAWKAGFFPKRAAWELAGVEDINRLEKMFDEEKAKQVAPELNKQMQAQGQPQGQPMPQPNAPMEAPPPTEQAQLEQGNPLGSVNPMPPQAGNPTGIEEMAGAMERGGEGAR